MIAIDTTWMRRVRFSYRACAFDALAGSVEWQVAVLANPQQFKWNGVWGRFQTRPSPFILYKADV